MFSSVAQARHNMDRHCDLCIFPNMSTSENAGLFFHIPLSFGIQSGFSFSVWKSLHGMRQSSVCVLYHQQLPSILSPSLFVLHFVMSGAGIIGCTAILPGLVFWLGDNIHMALDQTSGCFSMESPALILHRFCSGLKVYLSISCFPDLFHKQLSQDMTDPT